MDGYKRFTRVEKIKSILDNSYIKGSVKEYLNSKFYKDFNIGQQFSEYISEQIDKTINFTDYLKLNLDRTIAYTEYVAEQNFIQKKSLNILIK
jgi:hypothetical protein